MIEQEAKEPKYALSVYELSQKRFRELQNEAKRLRGDMIAMYSEFAQTIYRYEELRKEMGDHAVFLDDCSPFDGHMDLININFAESEDFPKELFKVPKAMVAALAQFDADRAVVESHKDEEVIDNLVEPQPGVVAKNKVVIEATIAADTIADCLDEGASDLFPAMPHSIAELIESQKDEKYDSEGNLIVEEKVEEPVPFFHRHHLVER